MRPYRLLGVWLMALLLVGGMAVSVVAIATTSHVEPTTPHVVQRTPAGADDLVLPSGSRTGDTDHDTDD